MMEREISSQVLPSEKPSVLCTLKSGKREIHEPSSGFSLNKTTRSMLNRVGFIFALLMLILAVSSEASIVNFADAVRPSERAFITLFTSDAAACHEACQINSKCRAYSWKVLPSLEGEGICSLKDTVPKKLSDPCCVIGVIQRSPRETRNASGIEGKNLEIEAPESAPTLETELTQKPLPPAQPITKKATTPKPNLIVAPEISDDQPALAPLTDPPEGLYEAVLRGDLSEVKRLIAEGVDLEKRKEGRSTPLLIAVSKNYGDILKALIHAGADIEAQGEFGESALEMAASRGSTRIVKILVDEGANFDRRGDKGSNLLALAALGGHLETLKYLLHLELEVNGTRYYLEGNIYIESPLMAAASHGKTGAILLLLKAGADPRMKGEKGQTALMLAADYGSLSSVSALLAAGAEIDVLDEEGKTALDVARNNSREMVARLLESLQEKQGIATKEKEKKTAGLPPEHEKEPEEKQITTAEKKNFETAKLPPEKEQNLEEEQIAPVEKSEIETILLPSELDQNEPALEIVEEDAASIPLEMETQTDYLGCFKDDVKRDLTGFWKKRQDMTTDKCAAICQKKGFSIAGTQYGTWCFCDNDFGNYGKANNCNMKCGGDPDQKCGGKWANSIFKIEPEQKETNLQPQQKEPQLEPEKSALRPDQPEIFQEEPELQKEEPELQKKEPELRQDEPELSLEDLSDQLQNEETKIADDLCEKIVGTWDWFNSDVVIFHSDGHVISTDNIGTWKCVDLAKRNYSLSWDRGEQIHQLTLSADGEQLAGTDQSGGTVTALRSKEGEVSPNEDQKKAEIKVEEKKDKLELIESAKEGSLDRSLELINLPGLNIDAQDESKMTALMWAAKKGWADIAKALLNAGANPNIKNEEGKTAVILAREQKQVSIVRLLGQPYADEKMENDEPTEKNEGESEHPLEEDFDRPGDDISGYISLSASECRELCAKEPKCSAFTWIRPGYEGPFGLCMLKSTTPNKIQNKCCVSGIIKINAPTKIRKDVVRKNRAERKANFPEINPKSKIP